MEWLDLEDLHQLYSIGVNAWRTKCWPCRTQCEHAAWKCTVSGAVRVVFQQIELVKIFGKALTSHKRQQKDINVPVTDTSDVWVMGLRFREVRRQRNDTGCANDRFRVASTRHDCTCETVGSRR